MADELVAERSDFRVRADRDGGRFWVDTGSLALEFRADIAIDSLTAFDRTITVTWLGSERNEGFERLTWSAVSTLWRKRLYLDVHQAHAEFHAEVTRHRRHRFHPLLRHHPGCRITSLTSR